jgi:hypothetical protein
LKYAIGEIALVVIGILIALQINTWNAEKLLVEKEKKHLSEIERDLLINIENFEKLKDFQFENMEMIDFLLNAIKEKRPYTLDFSTNLRSVKGIEEIEIITAGFSTASSFGLDNIRTDSLRSEIVLLFDHKYPNDKDLFQDLGRMHHESLVIPIMLKYFTNGQGSRPIPNNYQQLLESKEFVSMLGTRRNLKLALTMRLEGLIKASNTLKEHIQQELAKID